jgi:hypothetical protein
VSKDKAFLGTGWSFPPEFQRVHKRARTVSAEEDIRQALMVLFGTVPGERVMHPAYGCGLKAMVFEGTDPATVTEIRSAVERAVLFHEPRIVLNHVDVVVVDELAGELAIHLEYTIRTTNTRSNMVYPFYLLEGRSGGASHGS